MKEYIDLFDRKGLTVQDILDRGMQSQVLRDHRIFQDAVKSVYWELTLAEDKAIGDATDNDKLKEAQRLAQMRALLAEVVLVLDNNIFEAENHKE